MSNEDRIIEALNARLDRMEEQIAFLHDRSMGTKILLDELMPIGNQAFRLLIGELQAINGRVDLDDILDLLRRGIQSVPNLNGLFDQLANVADLWHIVQPAIAPTFPHIVSAMGQMERDGLFARFGALKDTGAAILNSMSPEEIKSLGDSICFLLSLLGKLSDPKVQSNLNTLIDSLGKVEMDQAKPVSIFGIFGALNSPEAKQGLGIAMELLKALGKTKS